MSVTGGWNPLSGPKVDAKSAYPGPLSSPVRGIVPRPPVPSTTDDGFIKESGCSCGGDSCGSSCGAGCAEKLAVNVSARSLLYRLKIPENTIPIRLYNDSSATGTSYLGSHGWDTNHHRRISKSGSTVTVKSAELGEVDYTGRVGTRIYDAPAGVDNIVEQDGSDSNIYTETQPNGLQFRYEVDTGRLVNIIDPDGRLWTYHYSTGTQLSAVENHRGRRVSFHYDGTKISAVEDTATRRTTFGYDESGYLTSVTGPAGCVRSYDYDGTKLGKFTDPDNYQVLVTYSSGSVQTIRSVDPSFPANDEVTTYTVPSAGVAKVQNPLGRVTTYTFDTSAGGLLEEIRDPENNVTTYNWDTTALRVSSVENPRGHTTSYSWEDVTAAAADTRKRLKVVNPASTGYRTTFSYATDSYELGGVQDPRGNRTTFSYASRHLDSLKNAKGEITTWHYSSDVLSAIQDPLNQRTTFTFGTNGMVLTAKDAEGNVTTYGYDTAANPTTVENALNETTTSVYDSANRGTSIKNAEGEVTTYTYSSCGLVETVTDPRGKVTSYVYDNNGDRTVVIDALGKRTTSAYDTARRLVSVKDARSKVTTFGYDKAGRRTTIEDALDQVTSYTYDANGNLIATKDPSGAIRTTTYDARNLVSTEVDALSKTTSYTFDKAGNRTTVKDARGNVTTSTYDSLNRATEAMRADRGVVTTVYDAEGKVSATVDALGNRTTNTYDNVGNLIQIRDALNRLTTFGYDKAYRRTTVKNAREAVTTNVYDKAGHVTVSIDALGKRTTTTYDKAGNVLTRTDPRDNTWTYEYDDVNRRTVVINPLPERTTTTYDEVGNVTETQYANNERVTHTYDALNRLETTKNPASHVMTNVYDDENRTQALIDYNAYRSTQTFDARGALEVAKSAEGVTVTHSYDAVGNRESVTDGRGNVTTYSYTKVNLLWDVREPGNHYTTFSYDDNGNRTLRHDADGNLVWYRYDVLNRKSAIEYSDHTVTFNYDAVGNLVSWVDQRGTHERTYDLRSALLTAKRGSDALVLTYTYDDAGNRQALIDEVNGLQTYTYDALNRCETVENPSDEVSTLHYDERGRREKVEYPNDTDTLFEYDTTVGISQIKTRVRGDPDTELAVEDYALDNAGNTTGVSYTYSGGDFSSARVTFAFDKDYRYTREQRSASGAGINYDITYAYDEAGNRDSKRKGGVLTTYAYDGRNLLESTTENSTLLTTYQYDNRGNRTLKEETTQRTTFGYDKESRLVTIEWNNVSPPNSLFTFNYDALGTRVDWNSDGTLVTEVWDGRALLSQDRDGTRERFTETSEGVPLLQNSAATCFAFDSSGTLDITTDSLDPPSEVNRFVATRSGETFWTTYAAYGSPIAFRGQEGWVSDTSTGLVLVGHGSFYDPAVGVFVSRDSSSVLGTVGVLSGYGVQVLFGWEPLVASLFSGPCWCKLELCCRPVTIDMAWLIAPDEVHCFVRYSHCCQTIGEPSCIEYTYSMDGKGRVRKDDYGADKNSPPNLTSCQSCKKCSIPSTERCLSAQQNSYPSGKEYYKTLGPNSNTYAATLWKRCCGDAITEAATGVNATCIGWTGGERFRPRRCNAPGIDADPPSGR